MSTTDQTVINMPGLAVSRQRPNPSHEKQCGNCKLFGVHPQNLQVGSCRFWEPGRAI